MQLNTTNIETAYEELKDVWQMFMEKGVIDKSFLRPEIYDSWIRSYNQDKDLSVYPDPLPPDQIKAKQEKNKRIMELALPVMQDINEMMKSMSDIYAVALFDNEGDIIQLIDNSNHKVSIQIGHRCSEIHGATSAPGLALKDGQLEEVCGYEHLYAVAHDWYTVARPIYNIDQSKAGVLGILNFTSRLPAIKPMVLFGAQLIELSLAREQISSYIQPKFLDTLGHIAAIINKQGIILSVNQRFVDFTGVPNEMILNHPLNDFFGGDIDYVALLDVNNDLFNSVTTKKITHFKGSANTFLIMDRILIRDNKNQPIILLLFKEDSSEAGFKNQPQLFLPPVTFERIIGNSAVMKDIKKFALKASHSAFSILLLGESGTGKDMIAQAIHNESKRSGSFIALNCGAVPKELLQSELFGYAEGAYTGAKKGGNVGKIVLSDKGTLFLDEVGEMPLNMQVSLLRFLQDKIVTPVGGSRSQVVDVRIIAATNRNLFEEMKRGNFREDLFYRLNVIQINMPSLSEHKEDIPALVEYMLNEISRQFNTGPINIEPEALTKLMDYHWPGNIRELKNVLESSLLFAENNFISIDCLPSWLNNNPTSNLFMTKNNSIHYDKETIIEVLQKYNGNITKASIELGVTRPTLYSKIHTFGINVTELRQK